MSIRYIQSGYSASKESLPEKVLTMIRREFGAEVEPLTLHLPVPGLLAGAWMACRETLFAGNGERKEKEVVATAVSTINRCPFCIDAHNIMLLESSGSEFDEAVMNPELRDIAAWASATLTPGSPLLLKPPFPSADAPAFIGTALFFHYINRMVTILLGASPLPFTSGVQKKVSMHLAAWFFGGAIRRHKVPGASLELLPEAPLPDDLSWAKPSPPVAGAFARFAQAVETTGAQALSAEVRAVVNHALQNWDGTEPDDINNFCREATAGLRGESEKCAGKLALLTAFAPYRVDETVVHPFSASSPGDEKLISALAWSSFAAARKIGSWLQGTH